MPNNSSSILHIAGRHVSEGTYDEFKSAGFSLHYWPVYEAVPVKQLPPEALKFIAIEKTNVILVFSGRTAQTLCHLLREAKLETSCKNHIAIGLSEPITNNLKTIPWKLCISSSHPTEQSMINRLVETIPAREVS